MTTAEAAANVLVGKFFHTTRACSGGYRVPVWQGRIVGEPRAGLLLIELCDWLIGERQGQQFIALADFVAKTPVLYESADEMRFSYEHGSLSHNCERYGCHTAQALP